MGAQPKLLLPLAAGEPVVRHAVVNALRFEPLEMVLVVRPDLPDLARAVSDLPVRIVPNPHFEEGVASSLAAGIGALSSDVAAALIMQADTPLVSRELVGGIAFTYALTSKPIVAPYYGSVTEPYLLSQVGPPTLFSRSFFPKLMELEGDVGGKQLLAENRELICHLSRDPQERPLDIDTPEDLQQVNALLRNLPPDF
jgi:molybdenum cofactor cytidylyltransferase